MEQVEISNAAKEALCICEYFDPKITMKISDDFLMKLKILASEANTVVKLDFDKKLSEQNISEMAKDLIALIYYSYMATEDEKLKLKETWNKNELEYREYIKEKYNPDNIFKKTENIKHENNEIVVYKKNFIERIIEKIKDK